MAAPLALEAAPVVSRAAPLVPTEIFREVDLVASGISDVAAAFRTSGTTGGGRRGTRRVPDLGLYRAGMRAPFVSAVLDDDVTPRAWLSLIPPYTTLPESSLAFMVDDLATSLASGLTHVASAQGLALEDAKAWLTHHRSLGEPVVMLTTALALLALLERLDAPTPLPAGSRVMVTGGFKGRNLAVTEAALIARVREQLALPSEAIVPEYGMTELTSQAYGQPFHAPPWLKLRVVDPLTLEDTGPGVTGLVAFFDLLNLDNISAVLSSDLGVLDATGGLTLLGRAPDAPRRGCSLIADAWSGS